MLLGCLFTTGKAEAQSSTRNRLALGAGFSHLTLLDRQASPLLYGGTGPSFTLGYGRTAPTHQWRLDLHGGLLAMQPAETALRFEHTYFSAQSAGFRFTYLHLLKSTEKSTWKIGASVVEDILIDLNYEVGRWPYALAQGGLYATGQWDYQLLPKHRLSLAAALPLLPIITDMPYHQIPRVEGRAPDVVSVFKAGTRTAFWNSYQRADINLSYEFMASQKWQVGASYQWAWFHDARPDHLWAYKGTLSVNIAHSW